MAIVLLLQGVCALPETAHADAGPVIDAIERLPRARRLIAYPEAINKRGISRADRLALTKAFAVHAACVSPHYLKADELPDLQPWVSILEEGLKNGANDAKIASALAQIYINDRLYSKAAAAVQALKKSQPTSHQTAAWSALCSSAKDGEVFRPGSRQLLTFPLHFCVLTRNPAAHKVATLEQCRKECDILNRTFRAQNGDALVRFRFKSYTSYADARKSTSAMVQYGDSTDTYDSNGVAKVFNACKDRKVRDPKAINVYIYDSYSARAKFGDVTSHGKRNSNRPYVLIDWERLDNKIQNAEAHEMGHAFGLDHVGVPGATGKSPTNIMASAGMKFGSGGLRTHGFTEAQVGLILYHAGRTFRRLGLRR